MNSIMIPVIAAVFIFNFTAISSLILDFYKKYNSILLLKEILNVYTLLRVIIIPAGFVVLFILYDKHIEFLSVLSIVYCIGSSIWLIYRTKYLLNQNRIIIKLLAEINDEEINIYKNNDILTTENRIDILLKIIVSFIRSNDFNSAEDIFNILFNWVNNNLELIKPNSSNYWSIKSNRFNRFFNCITNEVCNSSNTIIQDTYITSIYNQIIISSNLKNILNYEYIFSSLERFIENGLMYEKLIPKTLMNKAFRILLDKIPLYLYECKKSDKYDIKDKSLYLFHKSKDFEKLKNTLYEKIDSVISLATEKNNIEFLKSIDLFRFCFKELEKEYDGSKEPGKPYPAIVYINLSWNINYYQFLNEVTSSYSSIFYKLKDNTFNYKLWKSIFEDHKSFMYHFKELDFSDKIKQVIFNSFMSSYRRCLENLISNKYVLNYFEFYDYFCEFSYEYSKEQETYFIKLFILLTKEYFKYYFMQEIDNNNKYQIWSRVLQFQEKHSDNSCSDELNEYIKSLQEQYSILSTDYHNWEENQKKNIDETTKQIKSFWKN